MSAKLTKAQLYLLGCMNRRCVRSKKYQPAKALVAHGYAEWSDGPALYGDYHDLVITEAGRAALQAARGGQ